MRLCIGSGKRDFGNEWEHIDGENFPHIKSHDITKLPYEDNSVDLIYSSHTLEYFDREEVIEVLKEWIRVLKPEGELFLSVPDFGAMTSFYHYNGIPLHKFLGPLYGKMKMGEKTIYHKTVYDYASLGELLRFIGFRRIDLWEHKELDFETHDDCSNAMIRGDLISLNIKCIK